MSAAVAPPATPAPVGAAEALGARGAVAAIIAAARTRDRMRAVAVAGILVAVIGALSIAALALGAVALAPGEVVGALLESAEGGARFIVLQLRLPRLLLALLVGAALGLSGALLQAVVRNPLASPDVVGVTGGASAAAVLAIAAGATGAAVSGAALLGAAIAVAVVLLASGRGVAGARFIVVGIAVAFLAQGVLGYALSRASMQDAASAYYWLVGSVGSPSTSDLGVLGAVVAVGISFAVLARCPLGAQQLGDDTARSLGAHPVGIRVAAAAVSTVLAAAAVSVAGPLAFVAFVAGPIARRLRGAGPAALTAALVGAVLVLASDLVAQHLMPGALQPPAGLVTGAIGAPLLLWLLIRRSRLEAIA